MTTPETLRGAIPADRPMWPVRVQLRRRAGWAGPPGAVSVARPGRFGNPHRKGEGMDAAAAVAAYLTDLHDGALGYSLADAVDALAGRDLMCWCPLGEPCHADALLDLVNRSGSASKQANKHAGK